MAIVVWEINDDYIGNDRPQVVEVPDDALDECDNIGERMELIESYVRADFKEKVTYDILKVDGVDY